MEADSPSVVFFTSCRMLVAVCSIRLLLALSPCATSSRIASAVLVMLLCVSAIFCPKLCAIGPASGNSSSSSASPGAYALGYPYPFSLMRASTEYTPPAVMPSPGSAAGSRSAASARSIWYR